MSIRLLSSTAIILVFMVHKANAQTETRIHEYNPLGQLEITSTEGGSNDGDEQAYCYDEAGNRINYEAAAAGVALNCSPSGTPPPSSPPPPTPPPPPPPSNQPPVAENDFAFGSCNAFLVDLTSNDTDPEGNYPLALQSITRTSGGNASSSLYSAGSVWVWPDSNQGITYFEYVVADSLGATSIGQLQVYSLTCGSQGGSR